MKLMPYFNIYIMTKSFTKIFLSLTILLSISCQKKITYFAYSDARSYRFENKITDVDTTVVRIIAPFKNVLDVKMNEVLGQNDKELSKGKPTSPLTNWFCDAIKDGYKTVKGDSVDFVVQNYGGIRINSLGPGPVNIGKIYELMPFDNLFVTMDIDGKTVMKLLNKMAESGGWPASTGLQMTIRDSMATDVKIKGIAIDLNKTYNVGVSDYIANGGDRCDFLKAQPRKEYGLLIRDLVIADVRKKGRISPSSEKRIIEAKH
jgi:2',3'-cyclic-nucleotide 2'-phosphodiesterase (5'-nucleotidase family)